MNELLPRDRCVNAEQPPSSAAGTVPVSEFQLRSMFVNAERLPSVAGTVPVSELPPRDSCVNVEQLPSAAGMVPVSDL